MTRPFSVRAALAVVVVIPSLLLGVAVVLLATRDIPLRHLLSDPVAWAPVSMPSRRASSSVLPLCSTTSSDASPGAATRHSGRKR